MNAISIFLILVTAIVAFTAGFPAAEDFPLGELRLKVKEDENFLDLKKMDEEGKSRLRLRRATCDLLSASTPWGSLNHSACAAHCLAKRKGFKGGRCKSGVCHCRK